LSTKKPGRKRTGELESEAAEGKITSLAFCVEKTAFLASCIAGRPPCAFIVLA
jgi:hypothetical protein